MGDTEGDGGKTFFFGSDPEMLRCSKNVEEIFHIVRDKWMTTGMNGKALYEFAQKVTADMGWVLNMELTGHRLSEFPHSAYYDGTLAAVSIRPSPNLWVLEVQIKHPSKAIGGFFEDLLLEDSDYPWLALAGPLIKRWRHVGSPQARIIVTTLGSVR
jgi:methionyl aminopeptidase